jgi:hypothetical protein
MTEPTFVDWELLQRSFCRDKGLACVIAPPDSILGYAVATEGCSPVHGLRLQATIDNNGWYLWYGEYSTSESFFSPVHVKHLFPNHALVIQLLGLPPGYRFLMAENHLDIWYDPSLLRRP